MYFTLKNISPGRAFVRARRGPCLPCPPIQLTVEPSPVSRLPRWRSLSFPGGHSADGNRGNRRTLHLGRRRWPTVALTIDRSDGNHVLRGRRHWSSRVVAERVGRLNLLPRAHCRTDRRTVERGRRDRDAAASSRRLKRCPAVA